jgi:hypothetical protein
VQPLPAVEHVAGVPASPAGAAKLPCSWSHVEVTPPWVRHAAGTFNVAPIEPPMVEESVPSALSVRFPVKFGFTVPVIVHAPMDEKVSDPVVHDSATVQVPTTLPPQGMTLPQVEAAPLDDGDEQERSAQSADIPNAPIILPNMPTTLRGRRGGHQESCRRFRRDGLSRAPPLCARRDAAASCSATLEKIATR